MSAFDSLKNSIKKWGNPDDDEYIEEPVKQETSASETSSRSSQSSNSSKIYTYNASTTLHLVVNRPKKFSDAGDIAELYKNKTTVILMFNNTNKDVANRLIDFLGGVAYANGGNIKPVANNTFIITPYNVGFVGEDLVGELENNGVFIG